MTEFNSKKSLLIEELQKNLNCQIDAILPKDEVSSFHVLTTGKDIFNQKNSALKDSLSQFIEKKIIKTEF
jgi:hypothetical protein